VFCAGCFTYVVCNARFYLQSDTGAYCFEVPPGVYAVHPTLSDSEQAKGILLSPPERTVTISDV